MSDNMGSMSPLYENLYKSLEKLSSEITKSININLSNKEKGHIDIVMFISFDIVNSSLYKSSNYSGWSKVIYSLLNFVYKTIVKDIEDIKLWRTIGDELVFVVNIYEINQLEKYTQIVYEALNTINGYIKQGDLFKGNNENLDDLIENNLLQLKATAWIARVSEVKMAEDLNENITGNICYYYDNKVNIVSNYEQREKFREYQGKDIDLGFRIASENTVARKLSLSVELAYILSKNENINQKLYIVGYNKLKGVWNNRPYPIIWYHDIYISGCKLEDSFEYDEDEENIIVSNYFKRKNSEKIRDCISCNCKAELDKIVKDRNLTNKMNNIEETIKNSKKHALKSEIQLKADNSLEVHCVAVCVDKEQKKVLMFKRAGDDELRFRDKWDFGCAKVVRGWSFREALKSEYKNFSNIDISVGEPFRDYKFDDEVTGVLIPGIRYKATIENSDKIELNKHKYVDYRWVDLDIMGNMEKMERQNGESPFIDYDDFKDIIDIVLK